MLFDLNRFLIGLSYAIDCVESELLGVTTNHGKRVAYISLRLAQAAGLDDAERFDIAACAILHDNGLAQENLSRPDLQQNRLRQVEDMPDHCDIGEANVSCFPFRSPARDIIKFHHEHWNGAGFFGMRGDAIPLMAQIIGLADFVDLKFRFENPDPGNRERIQAFVQEKRGSAFSPDLAALFEEVSQSTGFWLDLRNHNIQQALSRRTPHHAVEMPWSQVLEVCRAFSRIIDSKSRFTLRHSSGLEEKNGVMATHYGMSADDTLMLRTAAALHDVGKLSIPNAILDKPGKLTDLERARVQEHTYYTRQCLEPIPGFEVITEWAANHHEKLTGDGYPLRLPATALDFNARLMTVLDIYQALTEDRPYREGLTHTVTMEIIDRLTKSGELEPQIVEDVRRVMA
ncbi:HD-GYP domain-containing protein [Magnetofaba australis]|nr:HD domain-containing phosphohydrolase [Magnetofaba australis]